MDGRQLHKDRYLEDYPSVIKQPEIYWPHLEIKYKFDIVLLDKTAPYLSRLIAYLKNLKTWRMVYSDEYCVVFAR